MKTLDAITGTKAYKAMSKPSQKAMTSASVRNLFNRAIAAKNAGWNYAFWEEQTGAGNGAKRIVKEIFNECK